MKLVLDTNVLVSGIRSRKGASNPLLVAGFRGRFRWMCSVPLFCEYEAVLRRAEVLSKMGVTPEEMDKFLTDVAGRIQPVDLRFGWRPQVKDPDDEMVLEAAANARADALVTHNVKDFGEAPGRFGVVLLTPAEALKRMEQ
ncbi:MAG: putative toxin-antitoxin system toxin component, PIN family [Rhodobacteraceae bacterium]|nr:putative toxin-antitoxin system toxin component, PIN family [Paracoccaceae bacterium]